MGLQNQLNDVSSESIPLLLIALIANCVAHLRSFLLTLFRASQAVAEPQVGWAGLQPSLELETWLRHCSQAHAIDDGRHLGSGLAGLIVLAEQLKLNRVSSYKYSFSTAGSNKDCVVCLCAVRDGERVRKLDCRHVFHKECFDGWLHHLNFNCPICRSPLVSDQRVDCTRMRVGVELGNWFSLR